MVHQVGKWGHLRTPNCEIAIKSSRNCEQFGMIGVLVILQSLSHVQLFVTPWTAACQASLSFPVPVSPGVCSYSCPLSQWCPPTISDCSIGIWKRNIGKKYWETKLDDWGGMSPLGRQWRDLRDFPLLGFYQSHPFSRKPSMILDIFSISFEMHSIQFSAAQCWGMILGSKSQKSQGLVGTDLLSPLE